jgi:hypothetical protein
MLIRCFKISVAVCLSFLFTISLCKIVLVVHKFLNENQNKHSTVSEIELVNDWLDENGFGDYKELFLARGK